MHPEPPAAPCTHLYWRGEAGGEDVGGQVGVLRQQLRRAARPQHDDLPVVVLGGGRAGGGGGGGLGAGAGRKGGETGGRARGRGGGPAGGGAAEEPGWGWGGNDVRQGGQGGGAGWNVLLTRCPAMKPNAISQTGSPSTNKAACVARCRPLPSLPHAWAPLHNLGSGQAPLPPRRPPAAARRSETLPRDPHTASHHLSPSCPQSFPLLLTFRTQPVGCTHSRTARPRLTDHELPTISPSCPPPLYTRRR